MRLLIALSIALLPISAFAETTPPANTATTTHECKCAAHDTACEAKCKEEQAKTTAQGHTESNTASTHTNTEHKS